MVLLLQSLLCRLVALGFGDNHVPSLSWKKSDGQVNITDNTSHALPTDSLIMSKSQAVWYDFTVGSFSIVQLLLRQLIGFNY